MINLFKEMNDEMMANVREVMKATNKGELNIITTIEENGESLDVEMGIIDLDGIAKEMQSMDYKIKHLNVVIKNLHKELAQRTEQRKRMGKRLEEKKYHIEALEKQIEAMKKVPRESRHLKSGDTIEFTQNYIYGTIQEIGLGEELTELWERGLLHITTNNEYAIPQGTKCTLGIDKHGFDLIFKEHDKEIILQCALLDEDVENGKASINIVL